jgi:hypothetical protein
MPTRAWCAALVLVFGAVLAVQGQAPPGSRAVVVTGDASGALTVWKAGGTGFEQVGRTAPRTADEDFAKRRAEAFTTSGDAAPIVADVDGDGSIDLVVLDPYGITVYGRTPVYFSLPAMHDSAALAVVDADGDGALDFVTQRIQGGSAVIEAFRRTPAGLVSLWSRPMTGYRTAFVSGDVDGDGEKELLTANDTVTILKRNGATWDVAAELPTPNAAVRAIEVADVDRDGKNEIVAGGLGGRVSVFKFRKSAGRGTYPVVWQSAFLAAPELLGRGGVGLPSAYVYGIAVADVNGDRHQEIVVSTLETGRLGDKDINSPSPRVLVFEFDGRGDFVQKWASGYGAQSGAARLVAGDVDGDGVAEIVAGRDVYRRASGGGYQAFGQVCPTCTVGAIGNLPELREPAATRVVPLYWSLANGMIPQGDAVDVTLTLFSPWGEAKDVTATVTSPNAKLTVTNGVLKVPTVPAKGRATTSAFRLTANDGKEAAQLDVEIAFGGVRQTVSRALYVAVPLPTYDAANLDARIAQALAVAKDENRRVLVQWSGKADPAGKALIQAETKGDLAHTLLYEYAIVRADVAGNAAVASRYKADVKPVSLPFLTVLDARGTVIGAQPASAFQAGSGAAATIDDRKLNEYLLKFKPEYVNAEPLFTAALSQAKKDQKTLFMWFSAPW